MTHGVILYGPPASGKDTITDALTQLDGRFQLFPRLKVGTGRTTTYRMTNSEHLDQLRAAGLIAWENEQYGATYAIDTPELSARLGRGTAVVHLGQVQAVDAVRNAVAGAHWLVVALWCPRSVAATRLTARGTRDVEERLAAWDATEQLADADLRIDTGRVAPGTAAGLIASRVD